MVRQTSCRFCGQDIEGYAPYRAGEWRDRGNNTTCPTIAGDRGLKHAPYRDRDRDLKRCVTCRGPVDARTVRAGGEVCWTCATGEGENDPKIRTLRFVVEVTSQVPLDAREAIDALEAAFGSSGDVSVSATLTEETR